MAKTDEKFLEDRLGMIETEGFIDIFVLANTGSGWKIFQLDGLADKQKKEDCA